MIAPQYRPIIGGYERAAERLSIELASRGHSVDVVTERRERDWPKAETFSGVTIRRLRCMPRKGLHVLTALSSLALFLLVRGRRYQVWHVHQYGWSASLAAAVALLLRRPLVLKITNTGANGIEAAVSALPFAALQRRLHRSVSACLATSTRARAEAIAFGIDPEHVHTVPNSLDCDRFSPLAESGRAELRDRLDVADRTVALFVGRLMPQKDPILLLEAISHVVRVHPELRLVVLGDGPLLPELEEYIQRERLEDSVLLAGYCEDPLEWYQAADFYVSSSSIEGLSNSLMEAMSCGLPVVCTRVSGSEDVVTEEVGALVEPGDALGLAEAIRDLIVMGNARSVMGIEARRRAKKLYSLDEVVRQVEIVYFEISPNPDFRGDQSRG